MSPPEQASARTVLLSRIADARLRDPAAAGPRVVQALREELSIPVRGLVGLSQAIRDETLAAGNERVVDGARRIHLAGELLLSAVDEVLDLSRLPAGKHADDWEAISSRLRAYLRPPVAAVLAYVQLVADDPQIAAHDRHVATLEQVAQSAAYVLALIDDLAQLLELLAGDASAAGASAEVRQVVERYRPAGRARRAEPGSQGSVLVVDDSQVNRDLLDRLLSRLGYRVSLAEGGLHGLALMRAGDFDLVLLDIIMPEVDGFQVLHQLKLDEVLRHVPVIMISALDEVESVGRCIEMGAEDYLTKPFDPVILKTRIGATLEKQRLRKMVGGNDRAAGAA
jgi:adenylate cyclase